MIAIRSLSRPSRHLLAFAIALMAVLGGAAQASAAETPRWNITTTAVPTNLHPGTTGKVVVFVANHGDGPTSGEITVTDKLPAGLTLKAGGISGFTSYKIDKEDAMACHEGTVSCSDSTVIQPGRGFKVIIEVEVHAAAGDTLQNEVSVAGGGAPPAASGQEAIKVASAEAPFGVDKYSLTPEEESGAPDKRAGSHPYQLTTSLTVNSSAAEEPVELPKTFEFALPAGLIGNPLSLHECSAADFNAVGSGSVNLCPPNTAVGLAELTVKEPRAFKLSAGVETVPVFLVEPAAGEPARLGFVAVNVPVTIDTAVRTGKDYGITAISNDASQLAGVLGARVMVWGVPGSPTHDNARGWECVKEARGFANPGCVAQVKAREAEQAKESSEGKSVPAPFLTMPTGCGTPLTAPAEGESWQGHRFAAKESEFGESLTCEPLLFEPSIKVEPEQKSASTPSGFEIAVTMPQHETAETLVQSAVKSTTVTFPQGVQLNPAAAGGLGACSAMEIGLIEVPESQQIENDHFSPGPALFPADHEKTLCNLSENSKVGTVKIVSPDLKSPVEGGVYLAEEDTNPFKSPLVVYIVAEDPESGVLVKLAGTTVPNEENGQIVSTFENTPQVPFKELKLNFFGGPRASLSTPEYCGAYKTTSVFTPWSGAAVTPSSEFAINENCPQGTQGFAPSFGAGSNNNQAGAFTSFTLNIGRPDGQQALTGITVHLPGGMAAMLSSITPCPIAQAEIAQCPESSLVGHSTTYSGLGGEPFALAGNVYLTGPYHGAPFGLSVATHAKAGPFDLGTIVADQTIQVDPNTAAVTVTAIQSRIIDQNGSNPLGNTAVPTRVKGVPVELKAITVNVDRSGFQFNPTNCNAKKVTGTLSGDQSGSAGVESNFQVANCASLPFTPKLVAETTGLASKVNGALFDVNVESPGMGQANIEKVFLTLPAALPSRLTTIQKACPDTTFNANPATCDEGSVIGKATIHTPVFKNPLVGPAYLVSHGNAAFPDVEFVLQGENVTIVLDGKTDIKKGITYSRFESAPDAPFTKFETELPMGPHSALTAYTPSTPYNLCPSKLEMPTEITGQNGAVIKEVTHIAVKNCKGVLSARETNAQKLAKALKACKKKYKKNKKKRQACEKAAHKKYAVHKASKKAKKKK